MMYTGGRMQVEGLMLTRLLYYLSALTYLALVLMYKIRQRAAQPCVPFPHLQLSLNPC